jgi:hypothetical protein
MSKVTQMPKAGGFTLVEAMISLFFVAFIVSQLAMISIHGAHTSTLARRVTRANMLADEAIEKTRNRAFPNIQTAMNDPATALLGETSCAVGMDYDFTTKTAIAVAEVVTCPPMSPLPPPIERLYRRYRIVRPLDKNGAITSLASSNKAQVDVIVDFNDVQGNPRQIRVSSVVSRY